MKTKKKYIMEKLKVAQVAKDDFSDALIDLIRDKAEFRDTDPDNLGLEEFMVTGGSLEGLASKLETINDKLYKFAPNRLADLQSLKDLIGQTKDFQYVMFI